MFKKTVTLQITPFCHHFLIICRVHFFLSFFSLTCLHLMTRGCGVWSNKWHKYRWGFICLNCNRLFSFILYLLCKQVAFRSWDSCIFTSMPRNISSTSRWSNSLDTISVNMPFLWTRVRWTPSATGQLPLLWKSSNVSWDLLISIAFSSSVLAP